MENWRVFERIVARLSVQEYPDSLTVIPNARILGYISGRKRQIDVLVDYRYNTDLSRRVIIDAKNKTRKIDVKEVEAFEGMMKDVGAQRGFIICTNGYSKAAKKRAQNHIGIRLISSDEIDNFNIDSWEKCHNFDCNKGLVLWDATPGIIVNGTVTVQATGKCDECGKFHVWCWGCSNRKVLEIEDDWQCSCKGEWFWLTAVESEEYQGQKNEANYLILVLNNVLESSIIDRRPL